MRSTAWKQVTALALCLDLAFAPMLAQAKGNNLRPPAFPTAQDLKNNDIVGRLFDIDRMLEMGEVPHYGPEDLDPWGSDGQYVRIYGAPEHAPKPEGEAAAAHEDHGPQKGPVIDQYFLDEMALVRVQPSFTKLVPALEKNAAGQNCLVLRAISGEDANGKNGHVVAEQFVPRKCGLVAVSLENEVLTLVHEDGSTSRTIWGYLLSQAFIARSWWKYLPVREGLKVDLRGRNVTAKTATVGMRPFDPSKMVEGAEIPTAKNSKGETVPFVVAGDLIVQADGEFVEAFSYQSSRMLLLLELVKFKEFIAIKKGERDVAKALRETIKFVEAQHFGKSYADIMKDTNSLDTMSAGMMMAEMGPKQFAGIAQAVEALKESLENSGSRDLLFLQDWQRDWQKVVDGAEIMNRNNPNWAEMSEADKDEDRRVNVQKYYPSKYQTMEERLQVRNPSKKDLFLATAKSYQSIGVLLAGIGSFMAFPFAVERSEWMQKIAFVNWLYRQMPEVLKLEHAAYRTPLIKSTVFLTLVTFLPDAMSLTAAFALRRLQAAAAKGRSQFAGRVRDMSEFWGDQKTWQRITTFGAAIGAKISVSPLVHLVETGLQQKAFFPAIANGLNPFRVITPESALGMEMELTESQSLGLIQPTGEGVKRKVGRLFGRKDPNSRAYEQQLVRDKLRLQAELKFQDQRRREYARMLATLAAAKAHGVEAVDILALMGQDATDLDVVAKGKALEFLASDKKMADRDLIAENLWRQMKTFAFEFSYEPIYKTIDVKNMKIFAAQAEEIAFALRREPGYKRYAKIANQRVREVLFKLWNSALNQGRDLLAFVKGLKANEDVYLNFRSTVVPDHIVVALIPQFFNLPYIASRANFSMPDQLAADANAFGWTTPNHMQDVFFNLSAHGAQGAVMDMWTYMKKTLKRDTIYESRTSMENKVMRRKEGQEEMTYPSIKKTSTDRHEGYLETETMREAFATYWQALKKVDFGEQTKRGMISMHNTLWIYVMLQLAMRLGPGAQPLGMALLGLTFAFEASPIFYKWIWYMLKPGNNIYNAMKRGQADRFNGARDMLGRALQLPDGPEKERLQSEGVAILERMYNGLGEEQDADGLYNRERRSFFATNAGRVWVALAPNLVEGRTTDSIDERAKSYLNLADRVSPPGLLANPTITGFFMSVGAVTTTTLSVPMLVLATTKSFLRWTNVLGVTALSYAWQFFAINFFSDTPVRRLAKKFVKSPVASTRELCQALLLSPEEFDQRRAEKAIAEGLAPAR